MARFSPAPSLSLNDEIHCQFYPPFEYLALIEWWKPEEKRNWKTLACISSKEENGKTIPFPFSSFEEIYLYSLENGINQNCIYFQTSLEI